MHRCRNIMLILTSLMLLPLSLRAEVVDWIAAVVNDEIICYSELQERVEAVKKASPELQDLAPSEQRQLERRILDQMILERLTAQEVKRHNIAVSDAEVDKALEDIKRSRGYTDDQLQYVLGQDGKTAEDLRQNLREEIERSRLIQRVLKSKTVITDEEVEARIRNRGPLEQDNRRRLALILLSGSKESGRSMEQARELARQIHERLEKGEDFAKLARQYSQGPAVEDGGDIGFITSDELAPPIEKATRGLEPGEFTEVVETGGSYYIFKVLDVQGPREAGAMNAEAREQVRKRLYQEEMNRKYEEWIRELEKRSFIKIHLKPSEGAS